VKRAFLVCLGVVSIWLVMPSALRAAPTEQDVFKSIHDSVGERTEFDSRPVILLGLVGGGIMLVFVAFNKRQQQRAPVGQKPLVNHPGRLMKEVLREVPLKPAEMKQLKLLAESVQSQVGETPQPLTMLLCPSLLAKGLSANPGKLDRKAVAQVVRKMKLQKPGG